MMSVADWSGTLIDWKSALFELKDHLSPALGRSVADKSPSIKALAEKRVSDRPNAGDISTFNSASADFQSINVPDQAATDIT